MKGKYIVEYFVLKTGETLWELRHENIKANSFSHAYDLVAKKMEDDNDIVAYRIVETLDISTFS